MSCYRSWTSSPQCWYTNAAAEQDQALYLSKRVSCPWGCASNQVRLSWVSPYCSNWSYSSSRHFINATSRWNSAGNRKSLLVHLVQPRYLAAAQNVPSAFSICGKAMSFANPAVYSISCLHATCRQNNSYLKEEGTQLKLILKMFVCPLRVFYCWKRQLKFLKKSSSISCPGWIANMTGFTQTEIEKYGMMDNEFHRLYLTLLTKTLVRP